MKRAFMWFFVFISVRGTCIAFPYLLSISHEKDLVLWRKSLHMICLLFCLIFFFFLIPLWVFGYNWIYYSVYVHHMSVARTTFQIAVYAGGVRLTSFFDVTPCSMIEGYWRFGGTCLAYLQCPYISSPMEAATPFKNLAVHIKIHGVLCQKNY